MTSPLIYVFSATISILHFYVGYDFTHAPSNIRAAADRTTDGANGNISTLLRCPLADEIDDYMVIIMTRNHPVGINLPLRWW